MLWGRDFNILHMMTGIRAVIYRITDHLGSVRVVKDGDNVVRQRFDYYSFGSESRVWTAGTNTPQSALRYRFVKKDMFYYPWRTFQPSWHIKGYFGDTEGPFLDRDDFERLKRCLIECGENTIIIAEEGLSGPFPIRLRIPAMITWEDICFTWNIN